MKHLKRFFNGKAIHIIFYYGIELTEMNSRDMIYFDLFSYFSCCYLMLKSNCKYKKFHLDYLSLIMYFFKIAFIYGFKKSKTKDFFSLLLLICKHPHITKKIYSCIRYIYNCKVSEAFSSNLFPTNSHLWGIRD